MDAIKAVNLAMAFFLELCLIAALAFIGFHIGDGTGVHWVAGIGLPALLIVAWGSYLAPRATRRLEMPWLLLVKVILFAAGTLGLFAVDSPGAGAALGVVAAVNLLLGYVWKQDIGRIEPGMPLR